ncbi:alkane hydroxylase MAH1-like [Trifolium pratense]|uniref:alkane hydroxylase MAH1-like n=1 Tax=Trifolium pratense TaxID=57577 RepID=UPI001E69468C|nr:alkane hydroxylase MAH1-like [Trifolium pratense]
MFEYITLFVAIFFMIFYNIWKRDKNNVIITNWPIIGMLPSVLHNQSNIHDYATFILKHYGGTFVFKGPWFTNIANFILTSDPMNVHHITSKNFTNYGKGSDFHEIFEVFGLGIFNLDTNEWKQERTLLQSLLKRNSFKIFLEQNIQKKLENCLLPFLDYASKGEQILDLQDILERFTFDIAFTSLFGFDSNILPNNLNELEDIAYVKAISVLEDMILLRHLIPNCIWKLQKWLKIGQEKKGMVAQEKLYEFLNNRIAYYKGDEEKRRLRSSEDVDESNSCLLKELMNEGILEKGEMVETYIRDTAINLLLAGNGSVSSSLNWFFWLVLTHPIEEAKIIQEIKDNCLTQEEKLIANLSVEELDKLVYLHGAICEALRLYPPIAFEHKCAIKYDILPSGNHVSPNTKLIYSLYAMGRMEQIWGDDCLEFKPERWISDREQIKHVPSYKFIAFNAGPRKCIGKDMSFVQMKMVAVALLLKFKIQVVEGHSITPRDSIVIRMKHGFKVKVSKRCV